MGAVGLLVQGGFIVWILGALSVVALTVILVKLWQALLLRGTDAGAVDKALAYLEKGERSQALLLVKNQSNPRARVLARMMGLLSAGSLHLSAVKEEAVRVARAAVAERASYLRVLDVIATVAPLLGLFGTVLGMIEAFQAMEAAGSKVNPSVLSGGIWVALLTTAVGLAVAIPVSMIHSALERRVEVEAQTLQDDIERVCTLEATRLAEKGQPKSDKHKAALETA